MSNKNLSDWEINFVWYVDFPHGEYFSDPAYRRKIISKLLDHHEMSVEDYINAYPGEYKDYCKTNPPPKKKSLDNAR